MNMLFSKLATTIRGRIAVAGWFSRDSNGWSDEAVWVLDERGQTAAWDWYVIKRPYDVALARPALTGRVGGVSTYTWGPMFDYRDSPLDPIEEERGTVRRHCPI